MKAVNPRQEEGEAAGWSRAWEHRHSPLSLLQPLQGMNSPLGLSSTQELPADVWKVFVCET